MTTKTNTRQKSSPAVTAVVQPASTRLSRMEDLLIEMRGEQDVKLRKINKLQEQITGLQERFDKLMGTIKRRLSTT